MAGRDDDKDKTVFGGPAQGQPRGTTDIWSAGNPQGPRPGRDDGRTMIGRPGQGGNRPLAAISIPPRPLGNPSRSRGGGGGDGSTWIGGPGGRPGQGRRSRPGYGQPAYGQPQAVIWGGGYGQAPGGVALAGLWRSLADRARGRRPTSAAFSPISAPSSRRWSPMPAHPPGRGDAGPRSGRGLVLEPAAGGGGAAADPAGAAAHRLVELQVAPLMEHVTREIDRFERNALAAGINPHEALVAKYALSGTADDIVQNLPGGDRGNWQQYSMVARFFHKRDSGVGFFPGGRKGPACPRPEL
jgi:type VI secretion system protein ImpK